MKLQIYLYSSIKMSKFLHNPKKLYKRGGNFIPSSHTYIGTQTHKRTPQNKCLKIPSGLRLIKNLFQ